MRSLLNFLFESKEDGKYLDLPDSMSKPYFWPGTSKSVKDEAKKKYKEYEDSVLKINAENFEILVDKLKKTMSSKQGHNNFILNNQNCKFDKFEFYGKKDGESRDFFDTVELAARKARIALETDDMKVADILKTRQREKRNSWDKDETLFWYDSKGFTFSIYSALCVIAQAYNIDIPKFDEKLNILATDEVHAKYEEMWARSVQPSNDAARERKSDKVYQKAKAEYEKDAKKVKKMREAFRKTDLYKDIISILDIVEDDLEAADKNFKKWETVIGAKIKKDEDAKKMADAMKQVKETVQAALKKSFHSCDRISWGVDNLYKLAALAYLESDGKQPEIKELSRKTGSWLSGMHKTCEFEVIGANDKSYGKVKLEDKGLDDDDGGSAPGFGPWD